MQISATPLLDKFWPEQKGIERKLTVVGNRAVEAMESAFLKILGPEIKQAQHSYYDYLQLAKKMSYTPEDVKIFSIRLVQFQTTPEFGEAAGLFLSALMNASEHSNFEIVAKSLSIPLEYLGNENTKNVKVDGDAGRCFGWNMKSGRLVLLGGAQDSAGLKMSGGELIINGNAGEFAGSDMEGGKLIVRGSAGDSAGKDISGGELEIMGNAGRLCGNGALKGKITVHGKAGDGAGYHLNGADVVVKGDCGESAGWAMDKGTLQIDGATGKRPGYLLQGGTLTLRGGAGDGLGFMMDKGTIIANCNVGEDAGYGMKGGLIRINGSMLSLGNNIHDGTIYQYQNILVYKGKMVGQPLED